MVAEIDPDKQVVYKSSWNIIYQCNTFTKHAINILKWDSYYDYRLYICDENGQTFVLHNVRDMKNLMVMPQPYVILKLMAKIYQLEVFGDLLLLSTQYKCVLYDTCAGELTQIGKRTIKSDTRYGVCFFAKYLIASRDSLIYNCIYCSRPKSRLWECDLKGNVKFTHIFKDLLINQVSQQIVNGEDICLARSDGIGCNVEKDSKENRDTTDGTRPAPTQMPTFEKLCAITVDCEDMNLMVTYNNGPKVCLYIINPINASIVSYCVLNVSYIHDMYCLNSDIYLLFDHQKGDKRPKMAKISFLTLEQCLQVFVENNEFTKGADFLVKHLQYFNETYCQSTKINKTKSYLTFNKLVQHLWSNLKGIKMHEKYQIIQHLISDTNNDDNNDDNQPIDESREVLLSSSSTESMTSDTYSNKVYTNGMYLTNKLGLGLGCDYDYPGIDVMDIGFTELKKLKNIVLSKFNNNTNQLSITDINNLEPPLLSSDIRQKQHQKLITIASTTQTTIQPIQENNSQQNNNEINCFLNESEMNKSDDDNSKQNYLIICMENMEKDLENSGALKNYRCECSAPLPGSHHNPCELQQQIHEFLMDNKELLEYSVFDLLDISKRTAIWSLHMNLMLGSGEYEKYLKYCLMLNDMKLLDNIQNYLFSTEKFDQLLKLFVNQRDFGDDCIVRCLECGENVIKNNDNIITDNSIKWETIMTYCVRTIGADEAITLLKNFIDRNPFFSIDFYLLLLRLRMISVYQSPVTREKLNKLMAHLNTTMPDTLKSPTVTRYPSASSLTAGISTTSLPSNQWSNGFKIILSEEICSKCRKSFVRNDKLKSNENKSNEKLVVFSCKHIYHKKCLKLQNTCILCDKHIK
ncbi:uncharacterized protein LOC128961726 [Oppia nitens]|uniref:uncharacterized protein LOC128961726 n=1 Tax=Oppia nitens TaxID=1686743 RepID=UPI0023DAE2C7|nr:uncharacterized protein LOC128961726 [Oppia nitens]